LTLSAIPTLSVEMAVGAGSTTFGAMAITKPLGIELWQFISNTACWISQGATPTATTGAGSMFVAAGQAVLLDGHNGAVVAAIQDAAGGKCTLTPMQRTS
jgi:hypothetical protein